MTRKRKTLSRERSCGSKVPYRSNTSASHAIQRMFERGIVNELPGHKLIGYYCRFCKRWHIGHRRVYSAANQIAS